MLVSVERISRNNVMAVRPAVVRSAESGDDVLDLSNVRVVDSCTVSLVLAFLRRVQARGAAPVLRGLCPDLESLMRVYGVWPLAEPFAQAEEKAAS